MNYYPQTATKNTIFIEPYNTLILLDNDLHLINRVQGTLKHCFQCYLGFINNDIFTLNQFLSPLLQDPNEDLSEDFLNLNLFF